MIVVAVTRVQVPPLRRPGKEEGGREGGKRRRGGDSSCTSWIVRVSGTTRGRVF